MALYSTLSEAQKDIMTKVFNRWRLDYFKGDGVYAFDIRNGFMGLFPVKGEEPLQDEFGYEISAVAMNEKGRVVFYRDHGNERYSIEASPNPWYVTTTDSFLSGWGLARKKNNNKLVIECVSADEADIVADNARRRGDQRYIKIVKGRPEFRSSKAYVQRHCRIGYERWFRPNGF